MQSGRIFALQTRFAQVCGAHFISPIIKSEGAQSTYFMIMTEKQWDKLLKIITRDDTKSNTYNYPYEPTLYEVLERPGSKLLYCKVKYHSRLRLWKGKS